MTPPLDNIAFFVAPCELLAERTALTPPIVSRSEALLSKSRDAKCLPGLSAQPGDESTHRAERRMLSHGGWFVTYEVSGSLHQVKAMKPCPLRSPLSLSSDKNPNLPQQPYQTRGIPIQQTARKQATDAVVSATDNKTRLLTHDIQCISCANFVHSRGHYCLLLLPAFGPPRTGSPTYGDIFLLYTRSRSPHCPRPPTHPCRWPQAPVAPASSRCLFHTEYGSTTRSVGRHQQPTRKTDLPLPNTASVLYVQHEVHSTELLSVTHF